MSSQDLADLHQIMGMLPEGDPRRGKVGNLLSQQLQLQAAKPAAGAAAQGAAVQAGAPPSSVSMPLETGLTSGPTPERNAADWLGKQAQEQAYKASGPESQGRSWLARQARGAASMGAETGRVGMGMLDSLSDPKAMAAILGTLIHPAIPAAYFGGQALNSLTGMGQPGPGSVQQAIQQPTPENIQRPLLDLSTLGFATAGAGSGAKAGPIGEATRAGISQVLPSIQRARAAFNHLDTGLADVTSASEPKFATHVERIGQVAQQVADRYSATKLQSVPPIVAQLLDRVADTSKPVNWTEMRQFKTDINWLKENKEVPSQFKGPLKNLVKTVDQGLRAGADLRGQGEVFSKANKDFRQSTSLEKGMKAVGPYVGAAAGAGAGYALGSPIAEALGGTEGLGRAAHAVPYLAAYLGKRAGFPIGKSLAGPLARAITERNVGPQSFPDIPASKVSAAAPAAQAAKPTVNVGDVSSAMENLGYKKSDALRMARDAVNRNPNDFNAAIKDAMKPKGAGALPSTSTAAGAAASSGFFDQVKAEHPDWDMRRQLQEAAKRETEARFGGGK